MKLPDLELRPKDRTLQKFGTTIRGGQVVQQRLHLGHGILKPAGSNAADPGAVFVVFEEYNIPIRLNGFDAIFFREMNFHFSHSMLLAKCSTARA